eukprot:3312007-Rhodomonas_salina.1
MVLHSPYGTELAYGATRRLNEAAYSADEFVCSYPMLLPYALPLRSYYHPRIVCSYPMLLLSESPYAPTIALCSYPMRL